MFKRIRTLLAPLFWSRARRQAFRQMQSLPQVRHTPSRRYKISGQNNRIILISNGTETELEEHHTIPGLNIRIKGDNNRIELELPLSRLTQSSFNIIGNGNTIHLGSSIHKIKMKLAMNHPCHNRHISFGRNLLCMDARMHVNEDNARFCCGDDCMFSIGIVIRTDGHTIMDMEGKVLNDAADIRLGDRVWLGENAFIMKNVAIAHDSVVGACSLVTKQFDQPNVIIAGNPAKIIKEGIRWNSQNASYYKRRQAGTP